MKYRITLNGKVYEVEVERGEATITDEYDAAAFSSSVLTPSATVSQSTAPAVTASGEVVKSPLPGVVMSIAVSQGENVKKGQTLLIIEAMKMENEIVAPRDCTIVQITAKPGASVNTGDPLLAIS